MKLPIAALAFLAMLPAALFAAAQTAFRGLIDITARSWRIRPSRALTGA